MRRASARLLLLSFALLLSGCDLLNSEDPAKAAAREAEGRAVGGACRHSGRALEDCYVMNPKAQKAAIYAGWRDMDTYMRENNIQAVVPDLVDPPTAGRAQTESAQPKADENANAETEQAAPEPAKKKATAKRGTAFEPAGSAPKRRIM